MLRQLRFFYSTNGQTLPIKIKLTYLLCLEGIFLKFDKLNNPQDPNGSPNLNGRGKTF